MQFDPAIDVAIVEDPTQDESNINSISMTIVNGDRHFSLRLCEFWDLIARAIDDPVADFRAGVWVGLIQQRFEHPERTHVPAMAVFVGDQEWSEEKEKLIALNGGELKALPVENAVGGGIGFEKLMPSTRCVELAVSGQPKVFVQPRVSYYAHFVERDDGGIHHHPSAYILPGLLTKTTFKTIGSVGTPNPRIPKFGMLYCCLRTD